MQTEITWAWGTNTQIDFNPATDSLDFGWLQAGQFTVSEANGAVVIAIPSNDQTYTLENTTLSELSLSNIVASDASAIGEWTTALGGSIASTPVAPPVVPVTPPVAPPPVTSPSADASTWSASDVYTAGMTVTENGVTYQANWWTQGADPSQNAGIGHDGTAWTIVAGGSTEPAAWSTTGIYTAGVQAVEDGVIYQANWWTQGNDPLHNSGSGQPWSVVGESESSSAVPSAPTDLVATAISDSSTTLSWEASSVQGGAPVTDYAVFENGHQIATTTGTGYAVTGLGADTTYQFAVTAIDAVGSSAETGPLSVHTASVEAVPAAPTDLAATATSTTSTILNWEASSVPGSATAADYAVFENGHQIGTTSETSYTVTGLASDMTYQFAVTAIDAVGSSLETGPVSVQTASPGATEPADSGLAPEFSPYIDMSLTADDNLVAISQASGIKNFTLAFVLSSDEGIGWQGVGSISDDTLANGTTILSQVQAIQAEGGNVTISFGGAAGQEPALTATSASSLQAEYQSVIDRYQVHSLDFDIEGAAVANPQSITLRDQALVGLEKANPNLVVSFTLPVLPTGLDANGLNVLQSAQHDGVKIGIVNIMAMDYGSAVDNNGQMGLDAIQAAVATEGQISSLGMNAKVGITPMIGVNDVSSEVFTLADAQQLVTYAQSDPNIVQLSMWSVARDNGNSAGAHYASPDSSGVAQTPYQFSAILHHFDTTA